MVPEQKSKDANGLSSLRPGLLACANLRPYLSRMHTQLDLRQYDFERVLSHPRWCLHNAARPWGKSMRMATVERPSLTGDVCRYLQDIEQRLTDSSVVVMHCGFGIGALKLGTACIARGAQRQAWPEHHRDEGPRSSLPPGMEPSAENRACGKAASLRRSITNSIAFSLAKSVSKQFRAGHVGAS